MSPEEWHELRQLAARLLSKHQEQQSSCQGKSRFETRGDALATIRRNLRDVCSPYHCTVCKGWHVGSHEVSRKKHKAMKANYLRMGR